MFQALRSKRATHVLVFLNIAVTIVVFFLFRAPHGGDMHTYLGLADGILHGRYSFWWWLPEHIPDTFRNPGYPLFLAAIRIFNHDVVVVQVAQLLLYGLSALFITRTLHALGGGALALNTFLLLLLPSINIAYYNTGIYAEPLTMFLIAAFVLVSTTWAAGRKRTVVLALLVGAAFQCRSSLLLFPAAWIMARWLVAGRSQLWREASLFLIVFACTTLPYAFWNLRSHGVLKPTPLEGGGGVMHMGWWSGKIPGHTEHWYWGNVANQEMLRFTHPDSVQGNIAAFEAEWAAIDAGLRPLISRTDSMMLEECSLHRGLFPTYSSAYTLAREKALKEATGKHIVAEPGYTIRYKLYSAVRLWVTGVNWERMRYASTSGLAAELYPFLLSLTTFLLALIILPFTIWKDPRSLRRFMPLLVWLIYFGAIHIPFVIQARYTIPVRFLLLAIIALCVEGLLLRRTSSTSH